MESMIGGFVSGLIVGAVAAGYLLSKWTHIVVRKRWDRLLDESPEYQEGQYNAFEYCLDLIAEVEESGSEQLRSWLLDAMAERAIRAENILRYKDDRASDLGMQDALAEVTNKEGP